MVYRNVYNATTAPSAVTTSSWGAVVSTTITAGQPYPFIFNSSKLYKLVAHAGTVGYYKEITNTLNNGDIVMVGTAAKVVAKSSTITIS